MLVLSRKLNEVIHIGPDITIQVVDISGGNVRLGITAPPGVKILRAELLARDMEHATEDARKSAQQVTLVGDRPPC